MIFESLASKRPQEAALFLRPYLVSVLGLPVAKPHLWSSLVCKDYIIPHIVTLFLYADSYIYIFPNRRLAGCIQFRLRIVSEIFCQLIFRKALSRKSRYCPIFSSAILVALSTVFKLLWNCRKLTVFFPIHHFQRTLRGELTYLINFLNRAVQSNFFACCID